MSDRVRVVFDISYNDLGRVMQWHQEGVISNFKMVDAPKMEGAEARRPAVNGHKVNGHGSNGQRVKTDHGIPVPDCLLAIMREDPYKHWHREDLGVRLREWQHKSESVSPALSRLKEVGMVESPAKAYHCLTEKGRNYNSPDNVGWKK